MEGGPAAYFCISPSEAVLWPASSFNSVALARSGDKKWRLIAQKTGAGVAGPQSLTSFAQQLKQIGDCEGPRAEQWNPDAQLYSIDASGHPYWGIIIKGRFEANEFESAPPRSAPSLEALRDAIGPSGLAELEKGGSPSPELGLWLQLSTAGPKLPVVVVYRASDGGLHWILEEHISLQEWDVRTQGLSRGLTNRTTIVTTIPPEVREATGTSNNGQEETGVFVVCLLGGLMVGLAVGWWSHLLYSRRRRLSPPSVPPGAPSVPFRDNSLLRTTEIIFEELSTAVEKESFVGQDAQFHKSALEWAGQRYKAYLRNIREGSSEERAIVQSIQHSVFQEMLKTKDLQEAVALLELGRNSREALRIICESRFATEGFKTFQQSKKRLRELVMDLPQLLEQIDTELLRRQTKIGEFTEQIKANQREVAESAERQRTIEQRDKDIKKLQSEQDKLGQLNSELDSKLRQARTDRERLDQTLNQALQLNSIASACAVGKRDFLSHSGRIQAASALAFLIDYSLFSAAVAILAGDKQRERVMRDNLRRISEKGKNKGIAGFNPEMFSEGGALDLQVHETDRHPDRPLFADTLKSLREFGDIHMHFDFDVDNMGVHRVR
jgi:hypothetical protein